MSGHAKRYTLLFIFLWSAGWIGKAQSVYFVDGYHGGVFGHYPKWQTGFMMDKLNEHPGWKINLELEPETFDSVKVWMPETYERFRQFMGEHAGELIEVTNPSYAQSYCYNISGESLIRQFRYGIEKLRYHFPGLSFTTYAVEEPCFTSALPQILHLFGFKYAVLKNPDTCYGGYAAAYGGETVNWIGPDGTEMLTIPRYEVERLQDNSTWQTIAWNNSSEYIKACKAAGIKNPVGMCYQDAGWKNGPWLGAPDKTKNTYILWSQYLDKVADRSGAVNWRVSQEDFLVSLMWGSQVLQKLSQEIRVTENKLIRAEKIASLQKIFHEKAWDQTVWDKAWRGLLMSQHHDCWIVPYNNMGSTGKTWAENVRLYTTESNRLCDSLISSRQPAGNYFCVYNTTGTARKEIVYGQLPDVWQTKPVIIKNEKGKKVPCQRISSGVVAFTAEVPAMGYTTYTIGEGKDHPAKGIKTRKLPNGNLLIENDLYRIEINPRKGGTLSSFYGKKEKREWIDSSSPYLFNELRGHFYEEGGFLSSSSYPAKVTIENNGPLQTTVRIEGKIGNHSFTQYLTLTQGDPRIDCRQIIHWKGNPSIGEYKENSEWKDRRKAFYDDRYKLHLLFPVALKQQQIYKNAPFDVCKSNLSNTFFNRWDSIKHNVILNWVDLYGEQDGYAFALFTDHTTSYLHGNDYPLGLTVQYSGKGLWGRNYAIREATEINYSLLPHKGNWETGNLTFENSRRNEPLTVLCTDKPQPGASLLEVSDKNTEISAVYFDGKDLIVRLYNEGKSGKKSFICTFIPHQVEEIDLNHQKIVDKEFLRRDGKGIIETEMPQFGLKTFRISYK